MVDVQPNLHVLNLKDNNVQIFMGDSRKVLQVLEPDIFQTCVTSPPYWGLRDYGVDGQIGAENELQKYIDDLVCIFREVRRLLKNDGTFWLNIGDSYTSGNRTWRAPDKKNAGRAMDYRPPTPEGLKSKDLIGVPWRLALALQEDGWYLRSDIVWYKPNCQPESVKDRPTRAHEYVFLFSKEEDYYYDNEAVKEPTDDKKSYRNRRSVWSINTKGYSGAHFAVFPPELVRLCILAGSRPNDLVLDPFLGTGTVSEVSLKLRRKCLGIELNPEYVEMANQRLGQVQTELGV